MRSRVRLAGLALAVAAVVGTIAAARPGSTFGAPGPAPPPTASVTRAAATDLPAVQEAEEGYPIENETVIARCERCHERDASGRMTRISFLRKTPEGWQASVRRMVALNNVRLQPEDAREIVRYLANRQGLAPEELEPGRFEVERRLVDHDYEGDDDVEQTCIQCHSMGRVITQRRASEEWELLMATHRGLYPYVDFQAFLDLGSDGDEERRHPMDVAVEHLASAFPLETPEWSAWAATMRTPRLAGRWALEGFEPGAGPLFGVVTVTAGDRPDEFLTETRFTLAESGETASRTGRAIVYTGHQWRGRSSPDAPDELREVMSVDRTWSTMSGRWFRGAYDELGPDVTLVRLGDAPHIAGVHPRALERGAGPVEVRVFGADLRAATEAADFDFGPGVEVETVVASDPESATLRVRVAADAPVGERDLFVDRASRPGALVIHDGLDRIEVTPRAGMARIGGETSPKGYQVFDAFGWSDGPDGERGTADDLELGRVPVTWSLEEYAATYDDDDVRFVGRIGPDGVFTPAVDGPNPERRGSRNNVGDVWVVATHAGPRAGAGSPLSARAHLIVTVPLYLKFDPWQPVVR